jgi:hypothetical protein
MLVASLYYTLFNLRSTVSLWQKFIAGLAQGSHTQVYVNRGLGGIKLRFLARPEITVLHLTLRASDLSPPSSGSIIRQDGTRPATLSPDHRATPHKQGYPDSPGAVP